MEKLYEKARQAICEWSRFLLFECIDNGLDVKETDDNGVTLLMVAMRQGNPDIIDILLKEGADVNAQDNDGNTALMYTFNLINVEHLVRHGADFTIKNKNGDDPVSLAFCENQKDVYDFYITQGAKADITIEEYASMVSANRDMVAEFLNKLYREGFNIGELTSSEHPKLTMLETMVIENLWSAVSILLKNDADPDGRDEWGKTALHYVMLGNACSFIAYELVRKGADVNAVDVSGNTPLHYINSVDIIDADSCFTQDKVRIINLLLESGADVEKQNFMGSMVAHCILNSMNDDYIRAALVTMARYALYKDRIK